MEVGTYSNAEFFEDVMTDKNGHVIFLNSAARRLFDRPESVSNDLPWQKLFGLDVENTRNLRAVIDKPLAERNRIALHLDAIDGRRLWLEADVKDDPRDTTGKIFFLYDVTDVHVHNALIRNCLNTCRGREIKHTGDGLMASFESVSDAVECSIGVQKAFAAYNQEHREAPLYLRIGLSAGEPIEEHERLLSGSRGFDVRTVSTTASKLAIEKTNANLAAKRSRPDFAY